MTPIVVMIVSLSSRAAFSGSYSDLCPSRYGNLTTQYKIKADINTKAIPVITSEINIVVSKKPQLEASGENHQGDTKFQSTVPITMIAVTITNAIMILFN